MSSKRVLPTPIPDRTLRFPEMEDPRRDYKTRVVDRLLEAIVVVVLLDLWIALSPDPYATAASNWVTAQVVQPLLDRPQGGVSAHVQLWLNHRRDWNG
ncbi:MAG: hypothetical protein GC129_05715 [Proteobacteria bacterium]|nr:hypothetical protein [Pseudomonadota bacterium]